ncbi:sigma-70 family RNA polymerase sigma factor [Marinomonas ostreistagni]|uniref:sigma-70 family RNA polymerase sigma factor n=1 Tax=Marinomonas ostreistagni TaxID=359209 RepID=UPI001951CC0C|nr:sigma-70 family RNA polymerase sigma factor [Marinomonas ostreistagni]MBM6550620.1 sigma-70 family RNA polymerase sigma factor [Marinomonas ostreistagni]
MQSVSDRHFADFYRQHHSWLQRFLARHLSCQHTAEDLTQDSFTRLITRQENLSLIDSPRAYLTTIAKGLLINHWRRQDIERSYLESLQTQPEAEYPSAQDQYEVLQALYQVDQMLQDLSSKARQAFLMSRLQGVRYQDIAVELEVSERMVKKYIAQAMLKCLQAQQADAS